MATPDPVRRSVRPAFHRHTLDTIWLLPLAGIVATLALLWTSDHSIRVRISLTVVVLVATGITGYHVRERFTYSFRTLANIIAAMRDGDFSIRPHASSARDPLGALATEINALGESLREQRLGALEASALLRTAIEEMDASVFTFDEHQRLRLANRAAERLLARPVEQLLGRTATDLGLAVCLDGDPARVIEMTFPGGIGRFGFRRSRFRQGGRPHQLLVVADLSRALREEERQAWQRLLRVLGHELNNSLAPIKSVAASLEDLCRRKSRPSDWEEDVRDGLSLITSRAESLGRFMQAYAQLARLPAPRRAPVDIAEFVQRAAGLQTRVPVQVNRGPDLTIHADRDQLEQLLINLLRNAADAVLEQQASAPAPSSTADPEAPCYPIRIHWSRLGCEMEIRVEDDGPGIANPANLFVPFFTTKPGGSGIGLSLCRQIAEAHEGRLTLENRPDQRGCVARLRLPI
jgi:nitrogen fixation/metabolism regulation signal transduction histidine kinase